MRPAEAAEDGDNGRTERHVASDETAKTMDINWDAKGMRLDKRLSGGSLDLTLFDVI